MIRQHGSAIWRAVVLGVRGQELHLAVSADRRSCDASVVVRTPQLEALLAQPRAREERASDVAPRPGALSPDEAEEQRRYFLYGKTGT